MDLRLDEIWPLKKHYWLHYVFDLGDSWTFLVRQRRKPGIAPDPTIEYPRIITITGERFSNVRRYPLSRRWTKYAEQTRNLFGRVMYLARRGRLRSRHSALLLKDET